MSSITTRRLPVLAIVAAVAIVIAVIAAILIPRFFSGHGFGRDLQIAQGQIVIRHVDDAKALPTTSVPGWLPADATAITTEVPGANSTTSFHDPVELDATLASSTEAPPVSCTPDTTEMDYPWDAWDGVDLDAATKVTCGNWTETVIGGHLYAWTTRR